MAMETSESKSVEDVISLESLDEMLAAEDPGFNESLAEIQDDEELKTAQIEADSYEDDGIEEADDTNSKPTFLQKRFPRLAQRLATLKQRVIQLRQTARRLATTSLLNLKASIREFKNKLPQRLGYLRRVVASQVAQIFMGLKYIWRLPLRTKLRGLVLVVLFAATVASAWWLVRGSRLDWFNDPLLTSYEPVATETYPLSSAAWLSLYEAFPQPEYSVLFERLIVNLRSESGHPNAMAFFDFHLSADSQDTAIELKDREKPFRDLIARSLEEASYSELNSPEGRAIIKALIRKSINDHLNHGRISRVYIANFILKP